MKTWNDPDPLIVLSGTDSFLLQRELEKAKNAAKKYERSIYQIDLMDLEDTINSNSFFGTKSLIIVPSASKQDVDGIDYLLQHKDKDQAVVIVHSGEVSATSLAGAVKKQLPNVTCLNFEAPKIWDLDEKAQEFLVQEMKRYGKTMDAKLAKAVIDRVGTDFGMLSFEALKYSTYLNTVGETGCKPEHIVGLLASMGPSDYRSVLSALELKQSAKVLKAIQDVMNSPVADRGVITIARTISSTAVSWLMISSLLDRGLNEQEIASRLEMKPFRISKIVPIVRRWKTNGLIQLIRGMAKADKSQRFGEISPWTVLQVELAKACQ